MKELEENLGYTFKNKDILTLALTHCSYSAEHGTKHNQRLEFLGDAVLESVISDYLYHKYNEFDEGKLTRLRASIVSEEPLSKAAEEINLPEYVLLGIGEKASGGAKKASVLSDTLESVFAAVYLDGGFEQAQKVILFVLAKAIENAKEQPLDYKTALQELLYVNGNVDIEYKLVSVVGPSHNSVFTSEVYCNGKRLGAGVGSSKKRAEQAAAKEALEQINK